jgi:chromate transporter
VADKPSLAQLAWLTARDVNATVGGGYAGMELLRRTFTSRGWLDADGHAVATAVSRLTPGTNILAYCVALGWRVQGARGALVALIAGSCPSAIIVGAICAVLVEIDRYRIVQVALAIATAIAVVLVLSSAWLLLRPYLARGTAGRAVAIAATAVALLALGVTPVRTLLLAAAVGCLWPMPPSRNGALASSRAERSR